MRKKKTNVGRNSESISILTHVEPECSVGRVIRLAEIERRLRQQRDADVKQLRSNYAEQNKFHRAVLRFRDLEHDARVRKERIDSIATLIGGEKLKDQPEHLASDNDACNEPSPVANKLPLWMAMRVIVEQVSEIQVVELQDALAYFGMKASRQAVESALASHRETFKTEPRGRSKFVSLT
jgi:hypothetical protein